MGLVPDARLGSGRDEQPLIGRKGEAPGTREFVLSGTPFIQVYDPEPPPVIWRVLHGAQKWP